MSIWLRILVTFLLMIVISYVAGVIWGSVVNFAMPSYISGVIGGLVAVPAWEILKRYKPKSEK